MNRIFFTLVCSATCFIAEAQSFQGTIKPGSTSTSVICAIKSSANYSDKPSNIQFTIAVPQSVGARPAMSILTNNYAGFFVTIATFQTATFGTDYIYLINMITPTLTTTKNYTASTEDVVAEVAFTGNVGNIADVRLVQLPNNGTATGGAGSENGNYNFYTEFAAGSEKTNQAAMFYTSTGGIVLNDPLGYVGYSSVSAGSILPLTWLTFSAQKENRNALLHWSVANQVNVDHFDVEAGVDPSSLNAIGKVNATTSGNYSFVHTNFSDINGRAVYYRIKQVDKDGQFTFSKTVKLAVDNRGFTFSIIRNPVIGKDLDIEIASEDQGRGSLTIIDLQGRKLLQQDMTWTIGNTRYTVELPTMASGLYSAILLVGNQRYEVKFQK